jgi:hypothetical protein
MLEILQETAIGKFAELQIATPGRPALQLRSVVTEAVNRE